MKRRLLLGTAAFTLLSLSLAMVGLSTPSRSAAKGPLVYSVRIGKNVYVRGEDIVVHATLKNQGKVPVSVYPPSNYTDRYWADGTRDLLALVNNTASRPEPSPREVVGLAPGASLHFRATLRSQQIERVLGVGVHRLAGEYDSTQIRFAGVWKGSIKTKPVFFTIM